MKKVITFLFAVMAIAFTSNAENYTIDDSAIDAVIENAVEVSPAFADMSADFNAPNEFKLKSDSPKPLTSFILCTFLGSFGIHRHYMGTSNYMWALYTFTFGGVFGIVPFVDWVFLLIGITEDDIRVYCNNDKFIMWA